MKLADKTILKEFIKRETAISFDYKANSFTHQINFIEDSADLKVAFCTRRCLAKGTMVATPKGAVAIENLRPGDSVFDENCNIIKVKELFDQGIQPVVALYNNGSKILECTDDHRFLTTHIVYSHWRKEMAPKDFYHGIKIVRKEPKVVAGSVKEPHAYIIGAFLGDGCKYKPKCSFQLSGKDESIIKKCANTIGASYHKCSGNNYTWLVQGVFNYFLPWMHGKYAHNKDIDFEVVKTWDRESLCQFLAGLIDTDGNLQVTKDGVALRIGIQNKKVLEVAQWIFLSLWGADFKLSISDRDHYVNGPLWVLKLKHNYHVNRIIKELSAYIMCERKKIHKETPKSNNFNPNFMGVVSKPAGLVQTYDIEVDSPTHLFLLANGLVSHNSAKSYSAGLYLVKEALAQPGVSCLYIALTRDSAKKILWKDVLKVINKKHNLKMKFNESTLTATMQNGSVIYLTGVDSKEEEKEKLLGQKYKLVIVDEAASYTIDLRELVYSVLKPAVSDYRGTICLIGTPGNLTKGLFYDITNDKEKGWSVHRWTTFDNPYMVKNWQAEIDQLIANHPNIQETPWFKQNYLGQWVIDDTKRVYKYDSSRNTYTDLPRGQGLTYHYVLGIDLGFKPDPTAFVVGAYSDYDPTLYIIEASSQLEMDITDVSNRIKELDAKYSFNHMVIDGAAKQSVEEMKKRHGLPLKTAEKQGKKDFIEIMNAEFIQGKIKLHMHKAAVLADEYLGLIWKGEGADREEHPSCPNHGADGALYLWRFAYTYLWEKLPQVPKPGSEEWFKYQTQEMERKTEEQYAMQQEEQAEQDAMFGDFDD